MGPLRHISIPDYSGTDAGYPFDIPAIKNGLNLNLTSNVTFFVGENGSGKSTILEALAMKAGFNLGGGNRHHHYETYETESPLYKVMNVAWYPHIYKEGFFMRAESFFNFSTYVDRVAEEDSRILDNYGGKSLHEQSHGEAFLSLFNNLYETEKAVFILDEPEAALSPARILSFLAIINQFDKADKGQFLIATHSPMLLCYPGATIFQMDEAGVNEVSVEETEHYRLTKDFLENPGRFFRHLFE